MPATKPNGRTVLFLKELYKSFLSDRLFLEQRLQAICKENGIGPKKLARCLKRGVVPVNFSFVDVTGTSVTEADVELNAVNFEFLQNYLGLFPQIPTAKESEEALCSVASEYSIVSRKASKAQIKDWASTEGSLHRALAAYIHRRYSQNQGARPGHEKMYLLKQIVRRVREDLPATASSSKECMGYALDTDETQVQQGPGAAADDDDDDLIIVEPHVNPLVEIEISEDEEVAESDAGSQSVAVVATDEQVIAKRCRSPLPMLRKAEPITDESYLAGSEDVPRPARSPTPSPPRKPRPSMSAKKRAELLASTGKKAPRPSSSPTAPKAASAAEECSEAVHADVGDQEEARPAMTEEDQVTSSPASSKKKKQQKSHEETEQVCPASSKKKKKQQKSDQETEQVSSSPASNKKKKQQKSEETEAGPASAADVAADRAVGGHDEASSIDDSQVFYARGVSQEEEKILQGADRIPLPNIPWPILGAAPDSGDALVKDVEKKHGPLGNELLKVQRSLRKNIRENLDDDDDDRDKEEKQAKPKAKSKAKSKAKAKAASKSKAKSKPQPEIERSQEDVMSDAAELEKEEEIELTKVQEDEDADGNNVKNAKGKRKKKKAQKATMDAEAEDKPAKPVKRRLEFDEEAEADESACAEDVAQADDLWNAMDVDGSTAQPEETAVQEAGQKRKKKKKAIKGKKKKGKKMKTATPEKEQPEFEAKNDDADEDAKTPPPPAVPKHCYRQTGWTPKISRPKAKARTSKPVHNEKKPVPKWKAARDVAKEQVIKDLRQLRLLDNSMQIPMDWAERTSFTLQPGPKVHENDDGLGIATIGVLFTGAFYVSPVTETRVAEVNAHAQKDRKIEANLKHGVHISWEKGNLGDIQDKYRLAKKVAGWLRPYWPLPGPRRKASKK